MATILKNILLAVYLIVCVIVILITTFQNKDNNNPIEDRTITLISLNHYLIL